MKSLAVIAFIAAIAGVALFCAQKRTVARSEALAATLLESNPTAKAISCDDNVPIGKDGAIFNCKVEFKSGERTDYKFKMNRDSSIVPIDHGPTTGRPSSEPPKPQIKKTSDPWGD